MVHLSITLDVHTNETQMGLVADPRRYVAMIFEYYERMFGEKLKKSKCPLEAGDYLELDRSDFCSEHVTSQYQNLIGQLQWLICF